MRPRCALRVPRVGAIAFAGALALAPVSTAAKDFGVRGATWPVAEPDLLVRIEARLVAMRDSGELARLADEARERARRRLEAPGPVAGIAPARVERARRHDPSIVAEHDIRAADGTLLARAGERVNPLDRASLTRELLFIDGRRPAEVAWALGRPRPAILVLLAGRPLALSRRHGRAFFFDQGGRLAARLGIAATPSVVEQAGAQLRITEVPVEDVPDEEPGE